MAIKQYKVVADFETTTDINDCRVWGACIVDIDTNKTLLIANNIDDFFEWFKGKNSKCYFHNLKFDGEFILSYLLKKGYKHSDGGEPGTFKTLISDMGIWYSITVTFERRNKKVIKVTFLDSLKKLPFKVSEIAKAFELPLSKLEIDYKQFRPVGHELTEEEKHYIVADCSIVAQALKIQFSQGLVKMTNASDAFNTYRDTVGKSHFDAFFPKFPVELDDDLRKAYKGGYVYLNPKYKNVRGLKGMCLDINSLYPWAMRTQLLPYSYPKYFEGEPKPDDTYKLFIVRFECAFDLKPNHIPTLQLKNNSRFKPTEYIESSNGDIIELTLTSVDLELFLKHYEVSAPKYICGFMFKGACGMFDEYIDEWMRVKENSTGAIRQLAKLQLNSLYGRFAKSPRTAQKLPEMDMDDLVHYSVSDEEVGDPVYTAVACFITAYARQKTITTAQALYDRFIYSDTDSIHIIGDEMPDIDIHPTRLGAWKHEGNFTDSKFIRAKTYMETIDGKIKVTCAGMPDNVKEKVTYDNFKSGAKFDGKLMPKRCPGGVVLVDTTFTIL